SRRLRSQRHSFQAVSGEGRGAKVCQQPLGRVVAKGIGLIDLHHRVRNGTAYFRVEAPAGESRSQKHLGRRQTHELGGERLARSVTFQLRTEELARRKVTGGEAE